MNQDVPAEAQRFRALRVALCLTQKDIAEFARIDVSTVSRFERGKTIQPRTVARMHAALWKLANKLAHRRSKTRERKA